MRRHVWIIIAAASLILTTGKVPARGGEPEREPARTQSYAVPSVFQPNAVWRDDGAIVAFPTIVRSIAVLRDWVTSVQAEDPERYTRIPDGFKSRIDNDEVYCWLWVHVADGARRVVRQGELVVTFTDSTSVRATGMVLFDPPGVDLPPQDSARAPLVLEGRADPEHTGRNMYMFLPSSAAGKTIAEVHQETRERRSPSRPARTR